MFKLVVHDPMWIIYKNKESDKDRLFVEFSNMSNTFNISHVDENDKHFIFKFSIDETKYLINLMKQGIANLEDPDYKE